MGKQILARQQGDDYQARWFWLQACAILDEHSKVERVVYEDPSLKSFDDVAVYYRDGYTNRVGLRIDADFYQVKFHVTSSGALTADSFCDPGFINATTFSLLQRMNNAHISCRNNNIRHRLHLYTPWALHPDDPLATLHSLSDGRFRWTGLSAGGDRSKTGCIRKLWRDHLGFQTDDDLRVLLDSVSVKQGPTLDDLEDQLNWRLGCVGLVPADKNRLVHPYDELTRKMLAYGHNELNAKLILEHCGKEGLLSGTRTVAGYTATLGIRSFLRWAEDLHNQTQQMICLSDHFNGRQIIQPDDWNGQIPSKIAGFITHNISRGGHYKFHLDTHSSIAFFTGNLIPDKMGVRLDVVQHSRTGMSSWNLGTDEAINDPLFEFVDDGLSDDSSDWAIAVGLTHDIRDEVTCYLKQNVPAVSGITTALPARGASASSVRNGAHAEAMANQLINYVQAAHPGVGGARRFHIFLAAPNSFSFCLGRKMHALSKWSLYEYDFGSGVHAAYSPSISNENRRY